jgi:hypothetical protein
LKIEKNCVIYIEYGSFGPYKIWEADKWRCPCCEYQILAGFGAQHFAEHYEPNFSELLKKVRQGTCLEEDYEKATEHNVC